MLNILYFASLKEALGQAEETISATEFSTVENLINTLSERGEQWAGALLHNTNLQIAVNHDIASRDTPLSSGDEIAFFPPVTGG
jgi:molybdopterin synthase sulfur carrier subunit